MAEKKDNPTQMNEILQLVKFLKKSALSNLQKRHAEFPEAELPYEKIMSKIFRVAAFIGIPVSLYGAIAKYHGSLKTSELINDLAEILNIFSSDFWKSISFGLDKIIGICYFAAEVVLLYAILEYSAGVAKKIGKRFNNKIVDRHSLLNAINISLKET